MTDTPPDNDQSKALPSLSIDWEAYLPFFENEEISDDDKRELIGILWSIMVSFVDLGFGIHPVQQACGENQDGLASAIADVLSCEDQADRNDRQDSTLSKRCCGEDSMHESD